MKTIKKIVFTGGPCSGKTTFTSRAEEIFAEFQQLLTKARESGGVETAREILENGGM